MAQKKRTEAQRVEDIVEIERMNLRGLNATEIARELSDMREYTLSRQQVEYDLRKLDAIWKERQAVAIDAARGKALSEIDMLRRENWAAWKRSQENAEVETTKMQGTQKDGAQPGRIEKQKRVEGQVGDARFLQGVQWCNEAERQVMGIDAPKQTKVSGEITNIVKGYTVAASPDVWDKPSEPDTTK